MKLRLIFQIFIRFKTKGVSQTFRWALKYMHRDIRDIYFDTIPLALVASICYALRSLEYRQ